MKHAIDLETLENAANFHEFDEPLTEGVDGWIQNPANAEPCCLSRAGGYACVLFVGHPMPHVAAGGRHQIFATWNDKEKS